MSIEGSASFSSVNTFSAFSMVGRNFSASAGKYTTNLKEKVSLISKFTNEFGVNLSSAANYGLGGCSTSNVESN